MTNKLRLKKENNAEKMRLKRFNTIKYKCEEIDYNRSGLFSVFIIGKGYLRADTLKGIKKLIDEAKK